MIDDLVTRGTREPYRMFTSRVEYRLTLREDNADLRLMAIGNSLGLIDHRSVAPVRERKARIRREIDRIRATVISPGKEVNRYLTRWNSPPLTNGVRLDQLLKRGELDYGVVESLAASADPRDDRVTRQVEIEIKYEGYIRRQLRDIEHFRHLEGMKIPDEFDFSRVHGLSNELKEKLSRIQPASLGQASRIEGITPAALSVLNIALKAFQKCRKSVFQGEIP
jgi:tRNA uridine 5-carboxymethylaminomethyl modification enzyme